MKYCWLIYTKMSISTIGFYPTISANPQVIQGEFHEILNDPLYLRDIRQLIVPLSDPSIYQKNKEYQGAPDLLTADENSMIYTGYGTKVLRHRFNLPDEYLPRHGKMGGSYITKNLGKLSKTIIDKPIDHVKRDIRKIARKGPFKKPKHKLVRPNVEDLVKIGRRKEKVPATKLRQRMEQYGKKHPNTFRKRTMIKNLLQRIK